MSLVSIPVYGQVNDTTLYPSRDLVGDLNHDYVKPGEMPGAIVLPGTQVSLAIGGFIKATALYDTKYNLKQEIITPGSFSQSDFLEGQTYFGAKSSRLFFDGRSTIDSYNIRGYVEMDFRGPYGITMRHIYLKLGNQKGQSLLMGQYWSNVMDLQTIPEGLVEPTMSGGPFSRHGQIKFTSPLSKQITVNVSIEEPNNADIRGTNVLPVNKYPDIVGSVYIDPSPVLHFSLAGLYRPIHVSSQSELLNKAGYLFNGAMIIRPGKKQKIAFSGMFAEGASSYVMGADGTAGFISNNSVELQTQYGGFFSYQYKWTDKWRSNLAVGRFDGNQISTNPGPHISSSTYGFINTFYHVNRYVNIGIEWIYTEKINYNGDSFSNNRFELGIQVF